MADAKTYERPVWMLKAGKYVGLREIKGSKHNAQIIKWFAACGHPQIKNDETAWCAAFVGGVLAEAGIKGTNSLMARSYEGWGVKIKTPVFGCIGTKKRAGGQGWQGHVGFVVAADANFVWLLGGNQNDAVSVARFARNQFTAFTLPYGSDVKSPVWPKLLKHAKGALGATEN